MKFLDLIAQLKKVLTANTGVEMVFGKAQQVNDVTIVPVARVAFGLGGGSGQTSTGKRRQGVPNQAEPPEAPEQADEPGASEGGGGGGGFNASPIGIFIIKGDRVRFHPVLGFKEIVALMGIAAILVIRIKKLRIKGIKRK
jgi:uncharacterized spore protein YtfJ